MPHGIPNKPHYKLGEVCEIADTQPYVLRFWESEFPQLKPRKSRTGHPIYTRDDVDLILRIKRLLHDQEFTLADARERLDRGADLEEPSPTPREDPEESPASVAAPVDPGNVPDLEGELDVTRRRLGELRDRYDAAVEEIGRLKSELDATADVRRERDTLRREADALRERVADLERAGSDAEGKRGTDRAERERLETRVAELVAAADAAAEERETQVAEGERLRALLEDARALLRDLEGDASGV